MAAKLTRMIHKIAIHLNLVAESCTICSSRSRRPVRKLLDTPSYATLRYAMLCYAMLCYAMLCYAMLCYAMLWYPILSCPILCYPMPCHAMPYKDRKIQVFSFLRIYIMLYLLNILLLILSEFNVKRCIYLWRNCYAYRRADWSNNHQWLPWVSYSGSFKLKETNIWCSRLRIYCCDEVFILKL
jgi:hypothetical protein